MKDKLDPVNVKGFRLLNSVKVTTALQKLGDNATSEALLAEYDKLGGAIMKGARKVAMGTFFDFIEKVPKKNVDYEVLGEAEFEDEYVLTPKKKKPAKRDSLKELLSKVRNLKEKPLDESPEGKVEVKKLAGKRGRPAKE